MKFIFIILFSVLCYSLNSQTFTLTFNPPDTTFKEILNIKKTTLTNDKQEKEDEIIIESQLKIWKYNDGYELFITPIKMNSKRNGEPFQNPLFNFLTSIPIRAILDSQGNMITVFGYESLIPRAQKELPPELIDQLILVANEEAMINKSKADWNARISNFAGQNVKIGDYFTGQGIFPIPNGDKLTFFSAIKIADTVIINDRLYLKIKFKNSSNPNDLIDFLNISQNKLKELFDDEANKDISVKIKIYGEGYRIIDPKTMLIYYEINNRTTEIYENVIGDEYTKKTIIESKEYNYKY